MTSKIRIRKAGEAIRTLRCQANCSVTKLARLTGRNRATIHKYEAGTLGLTFDEIERIAGALGLPTLQVVFACIESEYTELCSPENKALIRKIVESSSQSDASIEEGRRKESRSDS